ncbi:hypothetical protein SDC9_59752 [bioreactor metagenome]|uniref:IstB-like ATP-binding domain-containing protein n=1 Tax=bioreactor metagenome TaxID=1076179 RepID=A0A644XAZ3_9ZZZZ
MQGLKTVLEQVTGIKTRLVPEVCPKHGRYTAIVGVGIDEKLIVGKCPKCRLEEEEALEQKLRQEAGQFLKPTTAEETEQMREAKLVARIMKAGIPEEHYKSSFSNYKTFGDQLVLDVVNAFRRVCNSETMNLTVIGATGQGKSHLAAAALRQIAANDPEQKTIIRYVRESKMLRAMKASFSSKTYNGPSEQEIIDELSAADVLVIDEIGKASCTAYNAQALEEIMDARYQKRRTIILGNVTADDLVNHFTDGTRSRLTWKAEKLELNTGMDYRRRLELEG